MESYILSIIYLDIPETNHFVDNFYAANQNGPSLSLPHPDANRVDGNIQCEYFWKGFAYEECWKWKRQQISYCVWIEACVQWEESRGGGGGCR